MHKAFTRHEIRVALIVYLTFLNDSFSGKNEKLLENRFDTFKALIRLACLGVFLL